MQNVFILENKNLDSDCNYYSINGLNGETFCGIPIFGNKDSEIYSDLHFVRNSESVDLNIRFWYRDERNSYDMVLNEKIPMSYYFENAPFFPCKISDIHWVDRTFKFILSTSINGTKERLKVSAYVSIQG